MSPRPRAPRRIRAVLLALLLLPLLLWLVGDALHALHIRSRLRADAQSGAAATRRAANAPYTLNPQASPALLLLHGFADGPSVFAAMAPALADAGFAVRAIRLPGAAGTPPAEQAGITLDTWRAAIDTEIATLRAASPSRPLWLLGHSLGGTLAFDAALRPTNDIAGLILLAPLLEPSHARSPLLTPRQWHHLLTRALPFTRVVESRLPADLRDPASRAAYSTDRFIHRDIYLALFRAIDAVRPRAADWHGPLFLLSSPSDQVVDPSASSAFFFAATNAHPARMAEHYSGGHVLPLDVGHDRLTAKIIQFIRDPS